MRSSKSPTPVDEAVGRAIKARRVALGLTQEKLALALGLTFQQVQKYEKGTNRVSASRLQQIAGVLGTSMAALMPQEDASPVALDNAGSRFMGTREFIRIARVFDGIADPGRRRNLAHLLELAAAIGPAEQLQAEGA